MSAAAPVGDDAAHLLVVDDDRRIRDLLGRFLQENGYRVSLAPDAADARRKLAGLSFDLLVVDVMMPGETGTDFVRSLRDETDVPVLMLTALGETEARITGFEAGADDYLPKPFDPRELLMRVNAILKRAGAGRGRAAARPVTFGPFSFDAGAGELRRAGTLVHVTEREREILSVFARAGGRTVPRETLLNGEEGSERNVDVQITRLRRKIEDDPGRPVWLQTVRGVGYRLHLD